MTATLCNSFSPQTISLLNTLLPSNTHLNQTEVNKPDQTAPTIPHYSHLHFSPVSFSIFVFNVKSNCIITAVLRTEEWTDCIRRRFSFRLVIDHTNTLHYIQYTLVSSTSRSAADSPCHTASQLRMLASYVMDNWKVYLSSKYC